MCSIVPDHLLAVSRGRRVTDYLSPARFIGPTRARLLNVIRIIADI